MFQPLPWVVGAPQWRMVLPPHFDRFRSDPNLSAPPVVFGNHPGTPYPRRHYSDGRLPPVRGGSHTTLHASKSRECSPAKRAEPVNGVPPRSISCSSLQSTEKTATKEPAGSSQSAPSLPPVAVLQKPEAKGIKRCLDVASDECVVESSSSGATSPRNKRRPSLSEAPSVVPALAPSITPEAEKECWERLSREVMVHYERNKQSKNLLDKKMKLRDLLHSIFRESFPSCGLYIVGSSMNGMGSNSSDMDMCLMLTNYEVNQRTEATTILRHLSDTLSDYSFVEDLQVIYAKVPILKVTDSVSGVEVDVNVNNTVGIRNTQLLNCYARMDWRVAPLVLAVKAWARHHGINDARHMTLSSYSLALMVIHYLQYECWPAVVPCLQELMPDKFQPHADVRSLKLYEDIPPFVSQNKKTVGELFLGFLTYYGGKFDFSQHCISVRLGRTLPKSTAMNHPSPKNCIRQWKYICIEEPFDRTNTARAVFDPSAFHRIQMTFEKSAARLRENRSLVSVLPSPS